MSTIQIGVCGWGDHEIYPPGTLAKEKLSIYAAHFPVVEVDSTFYAIPKADLIERWIKATPDSFQFVVKAYRELTGHGRVGTTPARPWSELVAETKESLKPMIATGKISLLLFQFPPWFDCNEQHVHYMEKLRYALADYKMAIEFRNQSWFTAQYRARTLSFLEERELVHVICDEPQAGSGSVPIIAEVTNTEQVLIRFHGRNVSGWNDSKNPNWRDVRYAYRYSESEIEEWAKLIKKIKQDTQKVTVLFNNNSQGDAADNAKQLIQKLNISYTDLAPIQSELF